MQISKLTGAALTDALPALARLRIEVFRDFPYLYDGNTSSEEQYLQSFAGATDGVIVAAEAGGTIVGCATGSALLSHAALAKAFTHHGIEPGPVFYCGESVLLPGYRGQGAGHQFFDVREAHAQACGYAMAAFCAVVRDADHPKRPADYAPLDPFWRKRGYEPVAGLVAQMRWKETGQDRESLHAMQFWLRELRP